MYFCFLLENQVLYNRCIVNSFNDGWGLWMDCPGDENNKKKKFKTLVREKRSSEKSCMWWIRSKMFLLEMLYLKRLMLYHFLWSFYLITIITVIKCDPSRRLALALRAGLSEGWRWQSCSVEHKRKTQTSKICIKNIHHSYKIYVETWTYVSHYSFFTATM